MDDLARRLDVIVYRDHLAGQVGISFRRSRAIIVCPSGYEPRDEFTLAHELAELHIPTAWHRELPSRDKERACNRVAAAMMLPPAPFLDAVESSGFDINALRRRFPRASCETIATRIVDLTPGASATAWVDGRRQWWRGPGVGEDVSREVHAERLALRRAETQGSAHVVEGGVTARAWKLAPRGSACSRVVTLVRRGS